MIDLSKKLIRQVAQANARYKMIGDGDKVLLGLSGGKDSLVLAHLLERMRRIAPFKFELKAVTVSYGTDEDTSYLEAHCKEHGIAHEVLQANTYELALKHKRENSSICSFCARLRRGALYSYALENGFNKIALGHHLDDAVESFFMNFTYNGSLRSLPPLYTAGNGLVVIRPLISSRERQLSDCAKANKLVLQSEEACPANQFNEKTPHARASAKELLKDLESKHPKLFISLKSAFENIHLSSFMNEDYLE